MSVSKKLISKKKLTPEMCEILEQNKTNNNTYDWDSISLTINDPNFIDAFIDKINWNLFSYRVYLPLTLIERYSDNIVWKYVFESNHNLTTEFLDKWLPIFKEEAKFCLKHKINSRYKICGVIKLLDTQNSIKDETDTCFTSEKGLFNYDKFFKADWTLNCIGYDTLPNEYDITISSELMGRIMCNNFYIPDEYISNYLQPQDFRFFVDTRSHFTFDYVLSLYGNYTSDDVQTFLINNFTTVLSSKFVKKHIIETCNYLLTLGQDKQRMRLNEDSIDLIITTLQSSKFNLLSFYEVTSEQLSYLISTLYYDYMYQGESFQRNKKYILPKHVCSQMIPFLDIDDYRKLFKYELENETIFSEKYNLDLTNGFFSKLKLMYTYKQLPDDFIVETLTWIKKVYEDFRYQYIGQVLKTIDVHFMSFLIYQPQITKELFDRLGVKDEFYLKSYKETHNPKPREEKILEMKEYARKHNLIFDGEYLFAYRSHYRNRGMHLPISYEIGKYYKDWHCDLLKTEPNSFGFGIFPETMQTNVMVKVSIDDWGCEVEDFACKGKARVFGFTTLSKVTHTTQFKITK